MKVNFLCIAPLTAAAAAAYQNIWWLLTKDINGIGLDGVENYPCIIWASNSFPGPTHWLFLKQYLKKSERACNCFFVRMLSVGGGPTYSLESSYPWANNLKPKSAPPKKDFPTWNRVELLERAWKTSKGVELLNDLLIPINVKEESMTSLQSRQKQKVKGNQL